MAKITSNEFVKVAWILDANMTATQAAAPPAAILNGGLDLSEAISWQDFALGATDSDDIDDRSIVDPGNAVSRGFANFEGTLSFFRDANPGDLTSDYVSAWQTFKTPRTYGYLVMRVADKRWSEAFDAGDRVSVFRFIADTVVDDTEGDDSVKFTVNFLPQGILYPYTRVAGSTITGVASTNNVAIGASKALRPLIAGYPATSTVNYSSSDTSLVTVSKGGVITGVASTGANPVDITVSHPAIAAPIVQAVTVA